MPRAAGVGAGTVLLRRQARRAGQKAVLRMPTGHRSPASTWGPRRDCGGRCGRRTGAGLVCGLSTRSTGWQLFRERANAGSVGRGWWALESSRCRAVPCGISGTAGKVRSGITSGQDADNRAKPQWRRDGKELYAPHNVPCSMRNRLNVHRYRQLCGRPRTVWPLMPAQTAVASRRGLSPHPTAFGFNHPNTGHRCCAGTFDHPAYPLSH